MNTISSYVLVVIWHSGLNIADAILEDCFSGAEKRKGYSSLNWLADPPRGEGQVSDLKCIQHFSLSIKQA